MNQNADSIAGDRGAVDAPIDPAVAAKERVDVVPAFAEQVVIDQIDGGPGDQNIEQQQDETFVVDQKGFLAEERSQERQCAQHERDRGTREWPG